MFRSACLVVLCGGDYQSSSHFSSTGENTRQHINMVLLTEPQQFLHNLHFSRNDAIGLPTPGLSISEASPEISAVPTAAINDMCLPSLEGLQSTSFSLQTIHLSLVSTFELPYQALSQLSTPLSSNTTIIHRCTISVATHPSRDL